MALGGSEILGFGCFEALCFCCGVLDSKQRFYKALHALPQGPKYLIINHVLSNILSYITIILKPNT